MFLEFDGYFINLARVVDIGFDSEEGAGSWDLFVYLDIPDAAAIPMRSGFTGANHAEAFRRAVVRHACTTGLATEADLDRIFLESMPGATGTDRA